MQIAVIGAGLAGLSCASRLQERGHGVTVLDKARGPGGRMTTSRGEGWQADLGAQYFTARDPLFRETVVEWQRQGIVAEWQAHLVQLDPQGGVAPARQTERWVGGPRMSVVTRQIAMELTVVTGNQVIGINGQPGSWQVTVASGRACGPFGAVVVALPPGQAAPLLEGVTPGIAAQAAAVSMRPCWSCVVRVDGSGPAFDGAFVIDDTVLRWLARDSSKPGRTDPGIWVLHATSDYSTAHLEQAPETVGPALAAHFQHLAGLEQQPAILRTHRWRYSQCAAPLDTGFLLDRDRGVGVCGDWCNGDRVEGAWLSGRRLAEAFPGPNA